MTDAEISVICDHIRKIRRAFDPISSVEAASAAEATGRIIAEIIRSESKGD